MSANAQIRERILQNAKEAEYRAIMSQNDNEMVAALDEKWRYEAMLKRMDAMPIMGSPS